MVAFGLHYGCGNNLYYGIYKVPKGKERADFLQSFSGNQIRYWGLHRINNNKLLELVNKKYKYKIRQPQLDFETDDNYKKRVPPLDLIKKSLLEIKYGWFNQNLNRKTDYYPHSVKQLLNAKEMYKNDIKLVKYVNNRINEIRKSYESLLKINIPDNKILEEIDEKRIRERRNTHNEGLWYSYGQDQFTTYK